MYLCIFHIDFLVLQKLFHKSERLQFLAVLVKSVWQDAKSPLNNLVGTNWPRRNTMGKSVVYPVYTVCPHPFEVVLRKWVEMFDFFSLFRKKLLICCVLAYSESKKKFFFQRKICLWKNSCVCLLIITCLTPPARRSSDSYISLVSRNFPLKFSKNFLCYIQI